MRSNAIPWGPGITTLPLDAAGLPAGVYVVRAAGADWTATARFSVLR
jgi:hypothetical protein